MGKLKKDDGNVTMQLFAPIKMQAVTATVAWTPGKTDTAFCVTQACNYQIGSGTAVPIAAGTVRAIVEGVTYTFSVTQSLEIM